MRVFFGYLKPYWRGLLGATLAVGLATVCDLLLPALMSEILNKGVYGRDLAYIIQCCLQMLLLSALAVGSTILGVWFSTRVVAGFCADVREVVFRKVNAMSFEEFGVLGTAALVTRATHDVETVSWIASEMAGSAVTIPVLFLGGVVLAMAKDVYLALTMLCFVPVIVAVVLRIGKKILPMWDESDTYMDKQSDLMRTRLRGIRVIRAFNAEGQEHRRVAQATKTMSEYIIRGNVAMGLITPLATLLLNLATVLVVYLGGFRMETGTGLTGGDVFAVVQYISLVSAGVVMGAFAIIMLPKARVAANRISQVLNTQGMADPVARQDLTLAGEIRFEDVSFRYQGAAEPALENVSLHIAAGEKVAVLGGTGAGKSTLVSMLLGFRMPTEGAVYLDDRDTRELSRYTMRKNISCVLQNATIYSGTIRDNVAMGRENADDAAIWEALTVAQAREFVESYEDGLSHEIKQSGKNLSGGQKQRLSIARAVLKDAPIYIFDDSFSALDFLTEANLRRALADKIAGKTQIIITQRVSSAMHCQRIYVMDKGRVVGAGSHRELLESCQVYREIHASQTGGDHIEEE